MRISIIPIIRKDKIKKDSTAPIYIRVTQNRKSRFIGTGVTILINNWGGENKLVKQGFGNTPKKISIEYFLKPLKLQHLYDQYLQKKQNRPKLRKEYPM